MRSKHAHFFELALKEAHRAAQQQEIPIGAVLVQGERVLAKAHNLTEKNRSFLAHAEMLCLAKASRRLKSKFVSGARLYVTVEPCMMCRFAARLCRIEMIYYLAPSEKFGTNTKRYFKTGIRKSRLPSQKEISVSLLKNFFISKRN